MTYSIASEFRRFYCPLTCSNCGDELSWCLLLQSLLTQCFFGHVMPHVTNDRLRSSDSPTVSRCSMVEVESDRPEWVRLRESQTKQVQLEEHSPTITTHPYEQTKKHNEYIYLHSYLIYCTRRCVDWLKKKKFAWSGSPIPFLCHIRLPILHTLIDNRRTLPSSHTSYIN